MVAREKVREGSNVKGGERKGGKREGGKGEGDEREGGKRKETRENGRGRVKIGSAQVLPEQDPPQDLSRMRLACYKQYQAR
jgi:hypothetical protein